MCEGVPWSTLKEIQLLFNHLHRRQHRQPAKPQKHNQMVRMSLRNTNTQGCVVQRSLPQNKVLLHQSIVILEC